MIANNTRIFVRNVLIMVIMVNIINFALHISGLYSNTNSFRKPYIAPIFDSSYVALLINTSGCVIANLVPDTKLYKYFVDVDPIKCQENRRPLFESNISSIYMIESALPDYGFTNKTSTKCCFMWLKRMPVELGLGLPDETPFYQNECVFFNYTVNSPYEFIKVLCYNMTKYPEHNIAFYQHRFKKYFYVDFFYFVKPLPKFKTRRQLNGLFKKVNVLIFGSDSLSRINFNRQMPRTWELLNKLGGVDFLGYHKVGENTFPNVAPMLSGNSTDELLSSCFHDKFFDKCKMIWHYYKAQGYATAFIEDAIATGVFHFYYHRDGFLKQPTDYYWNIFYKESDKIKGNRRINIINYCFGARKVHEMMLEYMHRFVTVMKENKQPYFAYFWQSILSHNDFNQVQNGDFLYEQLLSYLYEGGYLNNTLLLFMSDHGNRIDVFRKTYAGMVEDRLPLLYIKLPDWMIELNPKLQDNLKINSRRLVTTYDIHETMKQLISVNPWLLTEADTNADTQRGYSLFSPIPENRTCESAAIPTQWCLCQPSLTSSIENNAIVEEIAEHMISFINNKILIGFDACAKMSFETILYARKSHEKKLFGTKDEDAVLSGHYTVAFRTFPGQSSFEGTVLRSTHAGRKHSLLLSGAIVRINTQYNESICITDKNAKPYCYCTDLL